MNKKDFTLSKIEDGDYWFDVHGNTQKELTDEYFEQGMREVSGAVYSFKDGQWGIVRQFMWNWDVITPKNEQLRMFIYEVAKDHKCLCDSAEKK